jgi:dienelactone hydrolase
MKHTRRDFIKVSGLAGLGLAGGGEWIIGSPGSEQMNLAKAPSVEPNLIGSYGPWANSLHGKTLPKLSFRNANFSDLESWKKQAKDKINDRLGIPDLGQTPNVRVHKSYVYDGLQIEEISWQLPYGNPTKGLVLKPAGATGKLPGILAFHCHGGNKYFGIQKITKTSDNPHELMVAHQDHYYEGKAWANEVAKRGYVVLIADAFTFASRRVMMADIPERQRRGLTDENPEDPENIKKYNEWASDHEHIMAKSLFCGGTTWPGVFFAEDRVALDILCARDDVNDQKIGCGGLSGGGMRTVMTGGLDSRISCAVCVGFMSTWTDFLLYKSFTHTWMAYIPILPQELDFPEILGLRVPLPTLVLNDIDDTLYTMPEMEKADKILQDVYSKAGASANYRCSYYPGPHKFDQAMQREAFDWFDKWLK